MSQPLPANVAPLTPRRSQARALLAATRPRQWTKNLLVLAGIVFAAKLGDATRWVEALGALVAYCAASSAAYLVNDVRDAPADRRHPVKRLRPIARGEVSVRAALCVAALLAGGATVIAAALGPASLACLASFAALQLAYTLQLKRIVLVDVIAIAGLFVLRAAAGAIAVDVRISPWLLVCTGLLALFLALGKRRGELVLVGPEPRPARVALEGYSLALLDQLIAVVASATIVAYAVYTFTARDSKALMVTIPLVVFGVFRYLLLLHRGGETYGDRSLRGQSPDRLVRGQSPAGAGEEPENILLGDVPILATVAAWAGTCAVLLIVYS